MLLYNEHLQQINPEVLLAELADVTMPYRDGLERLLSDYYRLAQRIDGGQYGIMFRENNGLRSRCFLQLHARCCCIFGAGSILAGCQTKGLSTQLRSVIS